MRDVGFDIFEKILLVDFYDSLLKMLKIYSEVAGVDKVIYGNRTLIIAEEDVFRQIKKS